MEEKNIDMDIIEADILESKTEQNTVSEVKDDHKQEITDEKTTEQNETPNNTNVPQNNRR